MSARGAIASQAGAAPRVSGPANAAGERRLQAYLVEDNAHVLGSLVEALQELAPVDIVGTAADEAVAVDWLRAEGGGCDLVIVDIFLRTGSGLGVIAAARERVPSAALVVFSNYATAEMRARCLAGGADRVYDKSREIDLLVAYCATLAEHRPGTASH